MDSLNCKNVYICTYCNFYVFIKKLKIICYESIYAINIYNTIQHNITQYII